MIYGNKFYNYGINDSIVTVIEMDFNTIDNLLVSIDESYITEGFNIGEVFSKIIGKIKEVVGSLIRFIKEKILQFGRFIKSLFDKLINTIKKVAKKKKENKNIESSDIEIDYNVTGTIDKFSAGVEALDNEVQTSKINWQAAQEELNNTKKAVSDSIIETHAQFNKVMKDLTDAINGQEPSTSRSSKAEEADKDEILESVEIFNLSDDYIKAIDEYRRLTSRTNGNVISDFLDILKMTSIKTVNNSGTGLAEDEDFQKFIKEYGEDFSKELDKIFDLKMNITSKKYDIYEKDIIKDDGKVTISVLKEAQSIYEQCQRKIESIESELEAVKKGIDKFQNNGFSDKFTPHDSYKAKVSEVFKAYVSYYKEIVSTNKIITKDITKVIKKNATSCTWLTLREIEATLKSI